MDSLTEAFKGQDAVISLVARAVVGDQNKFVDAAIAAGVKRFIPSEFGTNTLSDKLPAIAPVFEGKKSTADYLESKEGSIDWTSIITGPFFDWVGAMSRGCHIQFIVYCRISCSTSVVHEGWLHWS